MDLTTYPANMGRSRASSTASIDELNGMVGDMSIVRAGEFINLSNCNDENFISNAYKYCQKCLGGSWAKCSSDKFKVQYLMGGMTNYLYLCSLDDSIETEEHEPRKVLIRIYGSIVDQKHRFYEGVIFTLLSERGYGPKTLGVFYSGRIEEFIPHRALLSFELASTHISKMIARRVAEYHCLKLPLNKTPTILWENIQKFLDMANGVELTKIEDLNILKQIKNDINFESEYAWLKQMLIGLHSPVVFCHNDVQGGNILYIDNGNGQPDDVMLIDFDYSAYNYRGYDLGNHFGQYIYEYTVHVGDSSADGFIAHPDQYPSRQQQVKWATEYIETLKKFKDKSSQPDYDHVRYASKIEVPTIDELLFEVNRFAMASHLHWGLWSIVQGQASKIKFGYLNYAKSRFDEYLRMKKYLGYC